MLTFLDYILESTDAEERHPNHPGRLFLFAASLAEEATSDCSCSERHFTVTISLFMQRTDKISSFNAPPESRAATLSPDGGGSLIQDCPCG